MPAQLDGNRIPQTSGYLIAMKPETLLDWYEKTEPIIEHEKNYNAFRMTFSGFNVRNYRGVSRRVIGGYYPFAEDEKVENKAALTKRYELERSKYENADFYPDEDDDLFLLFESALEVYRLLDIPEHYEIIKVKKQDFEIDRSTLGFDIGYWGGDHFSLIADTLVTPLWHGAPEEDYQELRQRLLALNPNILFNNPEDASEFRDWYKSKDWAETEGCEGQFCIIQVASTF